MSVSLNKGQSVSLAKKGGGGITSLHFGLGWDPAEAPKKGLFSKLLSGGAKSIDLDASCIECDASGNAIDICWWKKLDTDDKAIHHTGDNLTGEGDGDDEVIQVKTDKLNPNTKHLVLTVNSFQGQSFNEVANAECRVVDMDTNTELCKFSLSEQGAHTGVVMGIVSLTNEGWVFKAVGSIANGQTAQDMMGAASAAIASA